MMSRALLVCACATLAMCSSHIATHFRPSAEDLSAEEIAILLAGFNEKRRLHNACPLVYDSDIADEIRPSAVVTSSSGRESCSAPLNVPGFNSFRQITQFSGNAEEAAHQPLLVPQNIVRDWYDQHHDESPQFRTLVWKGSAVFGCTVCRNGQAFVSFAILINNVRCKFKTHTGSEVDNIDFDPVPFTQVCDMIGGQSSCMLKPSVIKENAKVASGTLGEDLAAGVDVQQRDAIGHYNRIPSQFGSSYMWAFENLKSGTEIDVYCQKSQDCVRPCDVIVNVLHCPPCTLGADGGYPKSLPAAGWSSGSCAVSHEDSTKFTAFRTTLQPGLKIKLPLTTTPLANLVVFVRQGLIEPEWCPTNHGGGFFGPQHPVCHDYCATRLVN